MANQNVPTHVFSGGVTLKGNSFPSDNAAQITYGGFSPSFEVLSPTVTPRTIASTDGLVFVITPTAGITVDLPAAGASMDGRIYTFYVRAALLGRLIVEAGGVGIPGTPALGTAANTANIVTVIYSGGAVVGQVIQTA